MAIIIKDSTACSICGNILQKNDDVIGWTAFLPQEHELWKFSDTGMHKECFENWKFRNEFNHLYKFQPTINFDDPELTEQINQNGMPDWLIEIREYRESIKKK